MTRLFAALLLFFVPTQLVTRDAYLMATRVRLAADATTREAGLAMLNAALRVLEETERELSTWRDDSAISALNRHPVGEPWHSGESMCRTLSEVFAWHVSTGGAFDPGIGRVIAAWDIHGEGRVPQPNALAAARARSGMALFAFDAARCEVTRRADATIDVGAFGKGDALDRVRAAIGAGPWMVDLGGQVLVGGGRADGQAWTVDVAHPLRRDAPHLRVLLREGSLSTSGSSERDLSVKGTRVGHILDPKTGRPAVFAGSVTVWHRSAFAADALSTALYVMGPEDGVRWADTRGIAATYLIPEGSEGVREAATLTWTTTLSHRD